MSVNGHFCSFIQKWKYKLHRVVFASFNMTVHNDVVTQQQTFVTFTKIESAAAVSLPYCDKSSEVTSTTSQVKYLGDCVFSSKSSFTIIMNEVKFHISQVAAAPDETFAATVGAPALHTLLKCPWLRHITPSLSAPSLCLASA